MKLMQLNLWMGKLSRTFLPLIEAEQPDVLCLQEVFSAPEIKVGFITPDNMFNSLELVQGLGYQHTYFSPVFNTTYAGFRVGFGNAIVSKFPLSDTQTIFTNGALMSNVDFNNYAFNTRNMQVAHVQTDQGSLALINHHAHWEKDPLGSPVSTARMQLVADIAKQQSGPTLVVGDFNVTPESPTMRVFDGSFKDLTAEYAVPTTLSEVGKAPDVACDHILVNSDITVKSFSVKDELVSDHKALVLEFEI